MYLLDTNHCSRILDQDPHVVQRLATVGNVPLVTSSIVQGELVFMALFSERPDANFERVEALLQSLVVLPCDESVALWYGQLKAALLNRYGPKERAQRRRTTIQNIGVSDNDLWIAATAKHHNAVILSADTDFARIATVTDVRIESWL